MGNKTLTAVEQLIEAAKGLGKYKGMRSHFEQALALEKEQHDITSLDWFNEGERYAKREKREYDSFDDYYTTKYGKQ